MKNKLKNTICRKIKELRMRNGYSQQEIAFNLGMEQNSYSRLERGETKLDIERLEQLISFYQVSFNDLLNELPPPPQNNSLRSYKFYLHPQRLINRILNFSLVSAFL